MSNVARTHSPHVFAQDTFAFLVGINAEWPQGRNVVGDEALFHSLKETYKIPSDRIIEEELTHLELCELFKKFRGELIWFVIDSQLSAWRSDIALQSQQLRVGDYAFAKWKGGCPSSSLMKNAWQILPLWFPCEILSRYYDDPSEVTSEENCIENRRDIKKFCVMYHDRQTSYSWDDVVSIQDILPKAWFSTSDESLHDSYIEAQCIMAKRGQYITHSIPPNSHIRVKFWDGIIYEAAVSDWKDIPWDEFIQGLLIEATPSTKEIDGPYLPVWWTGEDMYSLMPLSHVIVTAGRVS